jgi:CheY-like chemotaxis protein
MNAVIGFTDLMLSEMDEEDDVTKKISRSHFPRPPDDHSREYLETIKSSGRMLLTLINDILDISKIESGQLKLEKKPFSLSETLKTVECNALGIISRTERPIVFRTPSQTVSSSHQSQCANVQDTLQYRPMAIQGVKDTIVGDSNRLQQILNNLLSNAIKFTESGSVEYKVQMLARPGGKQMLEFSVIDTGTGISKEAEQYIFEPFRQASNARNRTSCTLGGTGLGLSIARSLVETMGGEISLETSTDEDRHGSTFRFTIPYTPAVDQVMLESNSMNAYTRKRKRETVLSTIEHLPKLMGKIMIVDDNRVNLKLAERFVTRFGCEVVLAENGEIAVANYKSSLHDPSPAGRFDLILMDKSMPILDGIEATRAIRKIESNENRKRIPIIALTASAMGSDRDSCLEAGCDGYITKPLSQVELRSVLVKYLKERSGSSSSNSS